MAARMAFSEPPVIPPDQNPIESSIALKGLDKPGKESLKASGIFDLPGPIDPVTSGVYLRLADASGQLFELNLPPGAVGSSMCNPKDGWSEKSKRAASSFTYKNGGDGIEPACTPGAAGSKASLTLVDGPEGIAYKLAISALPLDRAPGLVIRFLQLDLVLGQQPNTGEGSTEGDAGLCAETILLIGDPTEATVCKVSAKSGVLKAVACSRD